MDLEVGRTYDYDVVDAGDGNIPLMASLARVSCYDHDTREGYEAGLLGVSQLRFAHYQSAATDEGAPSSHRVSKGFFLLLRISAHLHSGQSSQAHVRLNDCEERMYTNSLPTSYA